MPSFLSTIGFQSILSSDWLFLLTKQCLKSHYRFVYRQLGSTWRTFFSATRLVVKWRIKSKICNKTLNIWSYYILCVDISVIKPWLKMIPVKWYNIISLLWNDIISLHGLNCPIKQTVIIWLDQLGCTLYFCWRLASNLAGRTALQFYQRFLVPQFSGLIFFKHEIYNKQIITC